MNNKNVKNKALSVLAERLARDAAKWNSEYTQTAAHLGQTYTTTWKASSHGMRRAFWSKKAMVYLFHALTSAGPIDEHTIDAILASGADPNARRHHGKTALMYAAHGGHDVAVRRLIAAGADVEARDNNGRTALMYAADGGHDVAVQRLIDARAEVEARDNIGMTALMYAAQGGHDVAVKRLIAAGSNVNARDNNGATALMIASRPRGGPSITVVGENDEFVEGQFHVFDVTARRLIAAGADVNARNNNGTTALMYTVMGGRMNGVQVLIAAGADVNARNNNGKTALMFATSNEHDEIEIPSHIYDIVVERLIAAGANVNARDNVGMTALMHAVIEEDQFAVRRLIAAGADINARDNVGMTALMLDVMEEPWTLMWVNDAELLIGLGANVNILDNRGKTALMYAAQRGHLGLFAVRRLIAAGADVNIRSNHGWTALTYAARSGSEQVMNVLQQAGAHGGKPR
jgi:ankyrin repeat protein